MLLFLVLNLVPAYETMFESYRPSWTSVGRNGLAVRSETFITIKEDVMFGVNLRSYDVYFKERWHRLRLGFPLKPITIDVEERKKQFQGRIETNWLFVNIGISLVLWMLLEFALSTTRRAQRN